MDAKPIAVSLAVVLILGLAGVAGATMVTVPLSDPSGTDAGWSVTYDDARVDLTVDQVSHDNDYVLIQISKDFITGPNPVTHRWPAIMMDFIQRLADAETVSTFRIMAESISNQTGVEWTDFHWEVLNHDDAWLDVAASGEFGIQPLPHFQQQQWTTRAGEPNRADALDVWDGLVVTGSSYFPGVDDSDLVIQTDLTGANPLSFTFQQYPTPEPATLGLLAAGLGAALTCRRARRKP